MIDLMYKLIIFIVILSFPSISLANPFADITHDQAKADCLFHLKKQYRSNYSTIKFLLRSNMEAFDKLHVIPAGGESDLILSRLLATYYPSFSAIHNLYEKEIEAMREIEGI